MYDGKRLIPAPTVSVTKEYTKNGAGENIGTTYSITLNGTIVYHKGSPNSSGNFHTSGGYPADESISNDSRLSSIIRKQEAIKELFSVEGKQLEIQALDASQPMKCNPRVVSIDMPEGPFYITAQYTITLQADVIYINGTSLGEDSFSEYLSSATESWSIDTDEGSPENENLPRTYSLTHTINATGKRFYDETGTLEKPAWKQARDWVIPRLGFDSDVALSSGVINLPSYYSGYNHLRSENIDEQGGTYSVTETWVLASGTALETFDISTRKDISSGRTSVSIEGQITGLEQRDADLGLTVHKYDNAKTHFASVSGNMITRAQNYSGVTLNPDPLSSTIGRSPVGGNINYTYEFDNRPSNQIDGAQSEMISVANNWDADVFAVIPVLGRTAGPVLQNLSSKKEKTRSVNIEVTFEPDEFTGYGTSGQRNRIQSVVDSIKPGGSQVFLQDQSETWDRNSSRYSYNATWVYE